MSIRIGTCSWRYPSWHGLVYSAPKGINYLSEYAQKYDTVEIDRWFWSLFGPEKVSLPQEQDVIAYRESVPDGFRFTVKVPNSITLTHFYRKSKREPLIPNPHFLSPELFQTFLDRLEPLKDVLGPLMFQFEYLNKQKMQNQHQFQTRLEAFVARLDRSFQYGVETSNPGYFDTSFFEFLRKNTLSPVLIQGYYMPSIIDLYRTWHTVLLAHKLMIIRLHGPNRQAIERKTKSDWSRVFEPKDDEIARVVEMVQQLKLAGVDLYLNVNNHYEGSAPLTIDKIRAGLDQQPTAG